MADESESAVLMQLREMRSDLQQISLKLRDHDARFDKLDADGATFRREMVQTVSFSGLSNVVAKRAETKADEALDWQSTFDAEMQRLEDMMPDRGKRKRKKKS